MISRRRGRGELSGEGGFTLQEILVTIVVMGILLAIGILIFLGILERWRVDAATNQLKADLRLAHSSASNQLIDWRVVLVPENAEEDDGPDYYMVKLAATYGDPGDPAPSVDPATPAKPRFFPGNVKIINIRGALDTGAWIVAPSEPGITRTVEFNSDGTAKVYQAASGSTCVTVDTAPENRVIAISATSRIKVSPGECPGTG